MKSADNLFFERVTTQYLPQPNEDVLSYEKFKSALTEHDAEIKAKIENEIEQYKIVIEESNTDVDKLAYM